MTSLSGAAVLVAEMVALLLAVTFGVTLLQRRLGDATIRRWMGGPPRRAALKGIAVGFVTPFCTYSAIPVLVGMRQAGVRPAGYAAFIFAAPVVDP
ncbi:MAG: permease, partial [Acidimicrobiaceae bacterium]|nr:permease [Acidimicrobiaceae bacterium]